MIRDINPAGHVPDSRTSRAAHGRRDGDGRPSPSRLELIDEIAAALTRGPLTHTSSGVTPAELADAVLRADSHGTLVIADDRDSIKDFADAVNARAGQAAGVSGEPALRSTPRADYYPNRVPVGLEGGNCELHEKVKEAEHLGFAPQPAVCKVCPFAEGCAFQEHLARAEAADHAAMTAFRARFIDLEKARRPALVILSENSLGVLAPASRVVASRCDVSRSAELFTSVLDGLKSGGTSLEPRTLDFLGVVSRLFGHLTVASDLADVTDFDVLWAAPYPQYGWQSAVFEAVRRQKEIPAPFGDLFRVCQDAVEGRLETLTVVPNGPKVVVIAVHRARRPPVSTLVIDPCTEPVTLGTLLRRHCAELPSSRDEDSVAVEAWPGQATQVPERTLQTRRSKSMAETVRRFAAAQPGERLGVVVPQGRRDAVACLLPDLVSRVVIADTKSDLAKALGSCARALIFWPTPVSWVETAVRLIQAGEVAAVREGRNWGPMPWTGHLADGSPIRVRLKGNRHPRWRKVDESVMRARLRRLLARVPCPVTLITAEDLGLPLVRLPGLLTDKDKTLLELLRQCTRPAAVSSRVGGPTEGHGDNVGPPVDAQDPAVTPWGGPSYAKGMPSADPHCKPGYVTATDLAPALGVHGATVTRWLNRLHAEGHVDRAGQRKGYRVRE